MIYKSDSMLLLVLFNIYAHLKKDYDCLIVICGDTGTGKSRFALHLLETYYSIVRGIKVTKEHIKFFSQDYEKWILNLEKIKKYDMNVFDESSRSLASTDFLTKISKYFNKIFDVFRNKCHLSVLILPSFFRLNKTFRDERVRYLIWIDKRGHYKLYTKEDIKWINANNQNKKLKTLNVQRPHHQYTFPDYKGILLEPYLKQKDVGVNEVIKEVISSIQNAKEDNNKPLTLIERYKDEIKELRKTGMTVREIAGELELSVGTVSGSLANN